ncbi:hypothetical protein TTHERM_00095410 (macronuclear) [Tetrahymena thermophila SB210]|uniref:Uncharacterized protein n=1 Tax=Tetrahymena thermophila (strain SB210) TaxID=312017 RepID=Q235A6_TETTS|nr:hypothetical protein TTHERM_00095410 [Tetrahymena thermophila SB210]EAR91847.2 hypothetical protein TTHERM_00095410 [Tetrahymena thermophila SB210]|eukprot:XP_001012092.2 hypothetical protein TTHERM_00095410 [Tetrahymena thermophila SB210]
MSQKVPQRQFEYQQQFFEYQPIAYPQMQMQANLNLKNQNDEQFNKNSLSQPSQAMQKDLNSSLMKKVAHNSNNFVNSCVSSINGINGGVTNSNNYIHEQVQFTHSQAENSSQNGCFGSIQGLQAVATVSDDQNVVVNNQSYCNNPHSFFQNNESTYSANSKSLEVSNYHYRNGQVNDQNRIEFKYAQQQERQDYNFIPVTYTYQPSFDEKGQQSNIQQQQQQQDIKVNEEQKFHSKNYDSILENLGRKIENIAKIAKESEKHDIEIKKYISNENSIDYMLTSPSNNTKRQSKGNNNLQTFNNSDSKDFQDILLQDTDNKNNLLTNRSNSNLNQLTNRTHAQSITTLYNLNNNNAHSYHARHNSSSSLPLTERDRTFAQQQQFDLPSQRSLTLNEKNNKAHTLSQGGLDNTRNAQNNEDGSISSRQHYREYPSNIQLTQKSGLNFKNNTILNIAKKETDLEKVSKKLEDLLKGESEDADYVFYNNSVYSQCPHIYSQAKYVIFTSNEFEQVMQNKVSERETIISQQQKIKQLEETIADLNKKQQSLLDYQQEMQSKNNQLQENNATLLRTLGNISTEKASQQLRDGYKLQNYSNSINSNQNNPQKSSPESQKGNLKDSKISSLSYIVANQNISQDQEKRQVKLSVVGDKENQQKHNTSSNEHNKSVSYSQTTTQLQTPNTKLVSGASKQAGATFATSQTKRQQNGMGESQYFSKESSNTFNTEHYTSCDIEENKSTEPAHPDSMSILRQKTEDDEQISTNNYLNNTRNIGSLTNYSIQKNLQQQNQNNNSSYSHSQNQQLSNQSSLSNLHNPQNQQNEAFYNPHNQIQAYFNQGQMIQSQSGNSILVKNKPPMQPKQKGTVVIRDFLQQDNIAFQQNFNNNQNNNNNSKQFENQKKDLQRINSCEIEIDSKHASHGNGCSVERTSMDQKKLSATKLLKSKIIMNQQNSQEQIQKQLQEKQHILVEQLQNLTKNDDISQTVSTKLSSQNIQQLNQSQNQTPNSSIISSLSGLSSNNNHILKIQPSFLKNKASLHSNPPTQQQVQSSNNQLTCHPNHSKSIDSYQMQINKKQQEQQITVHQPSFTQGLRASVLAGKTNISQQQHVLSQKNDNLPEKQCKDQENQNIKKDNSSNLQKNGVKSVKHQENVKKSNLNQMNYHLIGSIAGQNQNNSNASVTYCQSNGSSQQSMSIEEFSSTSSRCKKGLSSFYIAQGCNSTNEQSQIPTQKIQKVSQGTNNNGVSGAMMTSFSQQMHDSSHKSSFLNNESFVPTVNKTTLSKNDPQQLAQLSQHNSVNDSNKPLKAQQQCQSQKMGQTTLLLKQITKNQPRQIHQIQNSNQNTTNSQMHSNANNYMNNFDNQFNKPESNLNSKNNATKISSYSLDKTQKNTTEIQNNPLYNFKIPFNHSMNKQELLATNLRANPNLGQTQIVGNNTEKRKSGSLTQRGSDYNDKPFDLKGHILQSQRERSEKSIPVYSQKENKNIIDNQKKTLEKRTKHTNSVPQFSSQSILNKPDTSKEIQQNQFQEIKGNKEFDSKFTQIRPSSVNSGLLRHFTSLNDQLESQDKPLNIAQNQQEVKQQIMTERIERNTQMNYKDNNHSNEVINQTQGRFRSLSKQGSTTVQMSDKMNGDQECNIF